MKPSWYRLSARHDLVRCRTCPITGARNFPDRRLILFKRWRTAQKCPDLREIHKRKEVLP